MTTVTDAVQTSSATGGSTLAGTGTMIRFMLRRDRVRLPVWILGITVASVGTLSNFEQTYPTDDDIATAAELSDLPAVVAMVGRNYSRDDYTYGVMMGHQMFITVAVVVALMSILLFVRHTRAEEEAGRAELIRSSVLGRHAQNTAAFSVVGGANVMVGLLTALGLGSSSLEGITMQGSFLYGFAITTVGLVFTGVAAATCQVTEYARGAVGMALAVLGLAYAVRAVGDVADNGLSWLSPLYWGQASRPYAADQRWWPLLLLVAMAVVLAAMAYNLSLRRDVGAGLRPPALGSPTASAALSSPLGLAVRLQRASVLAWAAGLGLLSVTYGSLVDSVEDMFDQITTLEEMIRDISGATPVEGWLVTVLGFTGMIASVQATLAVLRLRSEETSGRAEPILATAVARERWAASHLAVAFGASVIIMTTVGLGFGIPTAIAMDDAGWLGKLLGAALVQVPAIWVAVGLAIALFGIVPRFIALAWLIPAYAIIVVYMGQILQFPDWTRDLSPFGHVPDLPAGDFELLPIVVLLAITAALTWAGLTGLRRRDVYTK